VGNKKAKQQRKAAREAVMALYDEMPQILCLGLCHESCGSIPVVNAELPVFKKALKGPLKNTFPIPNPGDKDANGNVIPGGLLICGDKDLTCPALTEDLRCGIHASRPLICRLYGLVNNNKMRCPHGCVPERWVTDEEVGAWYTRLSEIERGKKQ
jgi:Fe-S-cluster containining protein